ncbi:MAG: elongation factor G [Calditrichaeota bacterium]|nr:elongation factor G [Calditrichota bacterium]
MKDVHPERIRNLVLTGHQTSGKTTLTEALLFRMGATSRMGSVEEGNTQSDYHPDEMSRRMSISTTLLTGEHKGTKINLLDTPGFTDFQGDVRCAIRVADTALMLINATSGIEVGTELFWGFCEERHTGRCFLINHLDKEHVSFERTVRALSERFEAAVPVQFPVGEGSDGFHQIVDLIAMKLVDYNKDGSEKSRSDIPVDLKTRADEMRTRLVERCAEADDALMEQFFANDGLSSDEMIQGLRKGILDGKLFPILCSAAKSQVGATLLLDFIAEYLPSPLDVGPAEAIQEAGGKSTKVFCDAGSTAAALVFKTISEQHVGDLSFFRVYGGKVTVGADLRNTSRGTTEKIGQIFSVSGKSRKNIDEVSAGDIGALVKLRDTHTGNTLSQAKDGLILGGIDFPDPVTRTAVVPRNRGDEEKISNALHILAEEDPSFKFHYDPELAQLIIEGQGELHLLILLERLKERFGVEVDQEDPKIPYRETIRATAEGQGKFKKQTGGRGQFGDCWLKLEPLPRGGAFEFVDAIVGGVIPGKFIPAVEKGVRGAMTDGVISGFPVVDVRVTVYDGSYHTVDSSENSFKIAGSMGFKKVFQEARPVVLEPIYDLEVRVPEEYMGDVMGDVSSKRGKILGMDRDGRFQVIKAKVPLGELHKYSSTLRSLTGGRGLHRQTFSHYEEVPGDIQKKLMETYEARRAKGGEEE